MRVILEGIGVEAETEDHWIAPSATVIGPVCGRTMSALGKWARTAAIPCANWSIGWRARSQRT